MAHAITMNRFKEIRDNRYTVITFKDGKRLLTYGNLSMDSAMSEVITKTTNGNGIVAKVYPYGEEPKHYSWDIADYN